MSPAGGSTTISYWISKWIHPQEAVERAGTQSSETRPRRAFHLGRNLPGVDGCARGLVGQIGVHHRFEALAAFGRVRSAARRETLERPQLPGRPVDAAG